jgi:hypothetical protein
MNAEQPQRIWFVALGRVDSESDTDMLAFRSTRVYGPFAITKAQRLAKIAEAFPPGSFAASIFKGEPGGFRAATEAFYSALTEATGAAVEA